MPIESSPTGGISLWIVGVLFIFFFLLVRIAYAKKYGILRGWQYRTVSTLRFTVFIIVLVIFSSFIFNRSLNLTKSPVIRIFLDNSVSAIYHQSISRESLKNGYIDLVKTLQEFSHNYREKVNIELFSFGSQVKKLDMKNIDIDFTEPVTDLSEIFKKSTKVLNDQFLTGAIIVTDGQITKGENLLDTGASFDFPVYSIGIGRTTPMVDINIESIDVPTVGIRGEDVLAEVIISSVGTFDERVNVSLSRDNKLISSRMLTLIGQGSLRRVKFQFKLEEPGENRYTVQVTSIKDEINIANNRSSFNIVTLKDQFKVALITGAPNPNTPFIKRVLRKEKHFLVDHFIHFPNRWNPTIAEFWRNKYDLIILDNMPTTNIPNRWVKDLQRKLKNFSSSIAYIPGQNIDIKKATAYFSILGIQELGGIGKMTGKYSIGFTNIGLLHPVLRGGILPNNRIHSGISLPPVKLIFPVEPNVKSLKTFAVLEATDPAPLFLIGEVSNISTGTSVRTAIFTSDKLWELHLKVLDSELSGFVENWWQRTFNWLVRSGGEEQLYFRVNKNTFQQGEPIKITGQIVELGDSYRRQDIKVTVNVEKDGNVIGTYPLIYSLDRDHWEGKFYASKPGLYTYDILVLEDDVLRSQQQGAYRVNESQIELNKVFLNKRLLMDLAKNSNGVYLNWDDRDKITDYLTIRDRDVTVSQVIQISHWLPLMVIFILLLVIEWIIRRVMGLQ